MASTMHKELPQSRSLGALFGELWRETSTLFRAETRLASAEFGEKVAQIETAAVSIGIGAAVLMAAFIILLMAAVNGLALALPAQYATWLSPLIVGVVVAVIGIAALVKGSHDLKARNLMPERTVRTLRDDAHFGREHVP